MSVFCIADSNLIWRCSCKNFRVIMGKSNIIYSLVVASIFKLRNQRSWIDPISIWLRISTKKVAVVSSKWNLCKVADKFGLWEDVHILDWKSSKFTWAVTITKYRLGNSLTIETPRLKSLLTARMLIMHADVHVQTSLYIILQLPYLLELLGSPNHRKDQVLSFSATQLLSTAVLSLSSPSSFLF